MNACIYCGHPAGGIDHVVPRRNGGDNAPSNLVPACAHCNGSKGFAAVEDWLHHEPEVLARLKSYQAGADVGHIILRVPPGRWSERSLTVKLEGDTYAALRAYCYGQERATGSKLSHQQVMVQALKDFLK
jgi:hypothetical protein